MSPPFWWWILSSERWTSRLSRLVAGMAPHVGMKTNAGGTHSSTHAAGDRVQRGWSFRLSLYNCFGPKVFTPLYVCLERILFLAARLKCQCCSSSGLPWRCLCTIEGSSLVMLSLQLSIYSSTLGLLLSSIWTACPVHQSWLMRSMLGIKTAFLQDLKFGHCPAI